MAATDNFASYQVRPDGPYTRAAVISPHDTNELSNVTRAILVGGAGNMAVVTQGGDSVTLTGLLAGHVYRVAVKQVKSTGTTATNLVALW